MFSINDLEIRNIEKKDMKNVINFAAKLNRTDNYEVSIKEEEFNYLVNTLEIKENFYVVNYNDQLLGLCSCISKGADGKEAQFEAYVDADYRKKGIGSYMYEEISKKIPNTNIKKLQSIVRGENKDAIAFVENRGFVIDKYMWKMDLSSKAIGSDPLDMEGLKHRKASKEDIEVFTEIMNECFRENEDKYTIKDMENRFVSPSIHIYIIEKDDYPVAGAVLNIQDDISVGYISHVGVRKECRGFGIGRKLLKICVDKVKEEGIGKASLHVDGINENALNLYKKVGFEVKGTYITFKIELQ